MGLCVRCVGIDGGFMADYPMNRGDFFLLPRPLSLVPYRHSLLRGRFFRTTNILTSLHSYVPALSILAIFENHTT